MSDWWSKDPLVQTVTQAGQTLANPEQWWANDPVDQPSMVSSAVRGAGQGLTLGAGDEMAGVAGASLIPGAEEAARRGVLPNPIDMAAGGVRLLLEKIAPGTFGDGGSKAYDRSLEAKRADNREHQKANPISYGAGEIVGGAVPVIAASAAAPAAFGVTGSLGMRSAMGAASGASVGALQGFMSGEGGLGPRMVEAGKGAGGGAVFGAVAPTAGKLLGAGYRRVADALVGRTASVPGASSKAVQAVADALTSDGTVNPAMRQRLADFGPDAMLMDAGESVKGLAQGVSLRPGEARSRIVDALIERKRATNPRIGSDLDTALGPAVVPSQVEAGLNAGRRAMAEGYAEPFANASAVDTRPLADALETMAVDLRGPAQRAVRQAREMLNIPGNGNVLDPNPRALFETRQALDGLLDGETNTKVIAQLGFARQAVDDYLARAVPGIKQVDARYAELARQSEGLARGGQVLDAGKTAIRPAEMADEITRAVQPEGMLIGPSGTAHRMREGTRAEIDRLVGTKSNDFLAVRDAVKGDGDWNRAKLVQLFGQDRADRVVNAVDREAAFERVYRDVVENSQTAMRQASKDMVAVRDGSSSSGATTTLVGAVGGPTAIAAQGAVKGARAVKGMMDTAADEGRNADIARLLLSRGPEMDAIFEVLGRNARGRQAVQSSSEAVDRIAQALLMSEGYRGGKAGAPYAQRVSRSVASRF